MTPTPTPTPTPLPTPLLLAPLAREQRDRIRAVRVGVVAVVAVVILVGALLVTGPLRVLSGPRVDVDFAFCGPIKPGASVRLAGVVVGVVDDVVLLAGRDLVAGPRAMVRVRARVQDRVSHLLTADTRFFVTTLGVLGEHYLDIAPTETPGTVQTPLADGARVDGVTLARADLLLPRASALLERADALLPTSPELARLMSATTSLVTTLSAILDTGDSRTAIDADVKDVRGLLADVRTLVRSANTGIGNGGPLRETLAALPPVLRSTHQLEDTLLKADVATTLQTFQALARRTDTLLQELDAGPVGDVEAQKKVFAELSTTLRSLDTAARQAERVLGTIDSKTGAGKLLVDDAFANDVKAVVKTVREDPLKLLFR